MLLQRAMVSVFFARRRRDHRLLRVTESACENIQRSDVIGVTAVGANDALKFLSSPVFGRHPSTARACPGGVAWIDSHKTNTVLLRKLFNPFKHLPVCPRRGRLAKLLASLLTLAFLQIPQLLHADDGEFLPRQQLGLPVNVIPASRASTPPALAAGHTMPDALADQFSFDAVSGSIRINHQLIDADVNANNFSGFFNFSIGNFNPQGGPVISKGATLQQLGAGFAEPVIEPPHRRPVAQTHQRPPSEEVHPEEDRQRREA